MSSTFANKILKDLSSFDDISIKTFFGGFSINCKGVMFGWIGEQEFYLRGHSHYRSVFIELGMTTLTLPSGISTKSLDYYKVRDELFEDSQTFHSMVKMVIKYAQLEQDEKLKLKKQRIKTLPNITLSLEKLLFSVGITNIEIFYKVGYLEAYYRIKNKNSRISGNVLFILYGSLNHRHVASLSKATKKQIELAYEDFLKNKNEN